MLTTRARSVTGLFLVALCAVTITATAADAGLTTPACLALKRKAWGELRKCQAAEHVKELKGKKFDPVKCVDRFDATVAKVEVKAAKAAVACRWGDNGDTTVTDYDSGLQWERKTGVFGGLCFFGDIRCVNATYTWTDARAFVSLVNGRAYVDTGLFKLDEGLAGFIDWRLPTIDELTAIRDFATGGPPFIDPIFGSTAPDAYWTNATDGLTSTTAWTVPFGSGGFFSDARTKTYYVRAVRNAF